MQRFRPTGPRARPGRLAVCAALAMWLLGGLGAPAARAADPALPAYVAQDLAGRGPSSIGDPALGPLMDAWSRAFLQRQPRLRPGRPWQHRSVALAVGALMFERADLAPMARAPLPSELAPYAHQFAGDMMAAPLLVRVAGDDLHPAFIAVNKRPGAPLPPLEAAFLRFVLSREGQAIVERESHLAALTEAQAAPQRALLGGYLAPLDPRLPAYAPAHPVAGVIRSVGSDGMKALMDRWMREFRAFQPGVGYGEHWEHLGTLNGYHALLAGITDIAPMGRELWPDERAAYREVAGANDLIEIRVARGGFDTPQRTTAQAIFVPEANPVARVTVAQIADLFGPAPTITRWGQLGATGAWAERPIHLYAPPLAAPNAMWMQDEVLKGAAWNHGIRAAPIAQTAAAIAHDPDAIGFGGFEEGGPGLKALAVARDAQSPAIQADAETAALGRYPLTRYMYIRLRRPAGTTVPPAVAEFLRFVLSRQGQAPVRYSGYFPLTAAEAAAERAKLQ